MAIIIDSVDNNYFELDGTRYPRIYQPLKQGSEAIGIYSIFDTKLQIVNSSKYDDYNIDGTIYTNQTDTIIALLGVVWSSSADVPDLSDTYLVKNFSSFIEEQNPPLTHLFASWNGSVNNKVTLLNLLAKNRGFVKIKNETGSVIEKGKLVIPVGIEAGTDAVVVELADQSNVAKLGVLGFVYTQTLHEGYGYTISHGLITGVTTGAITAGTFIYLSAAGGFTETKPASEIICVGSVSGTDEINVNVGSVSPEIAEGGGVTPGGSDNDVQLNDSGTGLKADSRFQFDPATGEVKAGEYISIETQAVLPLSEIGYGKIAPDDNDDIYFIGEGGNEDKLNTPLFTSLLDVNVEPQVHGQTNVYDEATGLQVPALTVKDDSELQYSETGIIANGSLLDLLNKGYLLDYIQAINDGTASCTDLVFTVNGVAVNTAIDIPAGATVPIPLLNVLSYKDDDNNQSIDYTATSFVDVDLTVSHTQKNRR